MSVIDTGTGIDSNDLPQLFLPFHRSHQPQARESAGAGLGLAITKGVVELHGGQIWVERSQPRGTEMHVTLPLRP